MKLIQKTVRLNPAINIYFEDLANKNDSSFSEEINRVLANLISKKKEESELISKLNELQLKLNAIEENQVDTVNLLSMITTKE